MTPARLLKGPGPIHIGAYWESIYCWIYIYIYIHRPLLDRGHQAARILEPINCYPVLAGLLVSVYHAGNGFWVIAGLQSGVKWLVVRAHGSSFNHHLTGFPQPGPLQGIPRKSLLFRSTSQIFKSQRNTHSALVTFSKPWPPPPYSGQLIPGTWGFWPHYSV